MSKPLLALAAVASLALAIGPQAHAQDMAPDRQDQRPDLRTQLERLENRVDQARARGDISQAEADRARTDIDRMRGEARSDEPGRDLQARIDRLRESLRPDAAETMDPAAWSLDRRETWMGERIRRASEAGRLSGDEDGRGRTELLAIRSERARLTARDGGALSEADRAYLARRIDELNNTLRWQGENPPAPWQAR